MTSIHIYDPATAGAALPELPPLPIGALTVGAAELLQQAADLPAPVLVSISDTQTVNVQFARDKASTQAITKWARRFGGIVTSYPDNDEPGTWTWCRSEFGYYGITVTAYAKIPVTPAAT